jgi:D-inositol-3-phosphate glycosyltransferase
MNVYVRSLASNLARAGVACDVFTRAESEQFEPIVDVEPGFRVVHLDAGPQAAVSKHELYELVEPMYAAAERFIAHSDPYDVLHANYWLSGPVAHRLKHQLDLPLVATFHTLARVKAEAGIDDDPLHRTQVEHDVLACADLVLASTGDERKQLDSLYGADTERVEIVPPGVDHSVFTPEGRARSRAALRLRGRVVLFAGRIQPLKGADLAVRALAALPADTTLLVVGGPSGSEGPRELESLHEIARELGVANRVRFVPPQPHRKLADYYRAADVCVVPSRTESFGLVALEAAACGTPVVAAAVGGLRSLVDDGRTGFLVEGREPDDFAGPVATLLGDAALAAEMGATAVARSRLYSWSATAGRLRRLYSDLAVREPVSCE